MPVSGRVAEAEPTSPLTSFLND